MKGYEIEYRFPRVVIEVLGGVASVAKLPAGVDVVIIDYDNAEGSEPTEDLYVAVELADEYWELDYRRGEMTAFVPRSIAATEMGAVNRIKEGHPGAILIAHGDFTHGDMWEEVEL